MKYAKPEVAELGCAINAVQSVTANKSNGSVYDGLSMRATSAAYEADE